MKKSIIKDEYSWDDWEWESFSGETVIWELSSENNIYIPKDSTMIVTRDNNYQIRGTVTGSDSKRETPVNSNTNLYPPSLKAGEFIENDLVRGQSRDWKYTIIAPTIELKGVQGTVKFESTLPIDTIVKEERKPKKSSTRQYLIDWFICGYIKNELLHFFRATSRQKQTIYSRELIGLDKEKRRKQQLKHPSRDYFIVDLGDYKFIVQKVDEGYGPDFAKNCIGIEYREEWGKVPDNNERDAIPELLGYLFGTQLIHVGFTEFGKNKRPFKYTGLRPRGIDVRKRCASSPIAPIDFSSLGILGIENAVATILPKYLEKRDALGLSEVLWRYWIAEDAPVGTNLPIIHSALETLAQKYIKLNQIKVNYLYMPEVDYINLLLEDFKNIEEKLVEKGLSQDAIKGLVGKLKSAYQRGSTQSINILFEGLNIKHTQVETKALKARNSMAHAFGKKNQKEFRELVLLSRAYTSLFNRVILKLLDYEGTYIDYFTFGMPSRDINEGIIG